MIGGTGHDTNDGLKALNAEIKHLIYDKNDETKITIII